ncbi:MAG: substrate-binding domain-containing protein, partial [Candidatus Brocadiae bacterium]|nr:substrate-binding domain-containing protein [Candidatus Brocadiia bacterium]
MAPTRRIAAILGAPPLSQRHREILRGCAEHAEAAGWRLVLDPAALRRPAGAYDGILVRTKQGLASSLRDSAAPFVCIDWSQRQQGYAHAIENRFAAGRMAARHLVERGYRSFAYVGFTRQIQSRVERVQFDHALRWLGRGVATARTYATFADMPRGWGKVVTALGEWLGQRRYPAGIFAAQPVLARAVADQALDRGLRVPEDVGVVAADDDPVVCGLPPSLSSLRFDYAQVGRLAARLLERLMEGAPAPYRASFVPPVLVPRQSTDRQAAGDPLVADALWFIDSRRTEPIHAPQVAAALGVGARTLQRRFRAAGRLTVEQEIVQARVEHA